MSPNPNEENGGTSPYLLLSATMVLWGSGFASSKSLVDHMPHTVAAVLRFGGGAIFLLVALRLFGQRGARTSPRDMIRAAVAGLLGVFVYNFFFFWGLALAPSMDGSTVIPVMSPVLTTGFLLLTGREKASVVRTVGLVVGVVGAAVFLIGAGVSGDGTDRLLGNVMFFLSAASWAGYTLLGKRVLTGIDPLKATTYATVAGSVLLVLYAAPSYGDVDWDGLSVPLWLNAVYLAIGPTAIAYLFYYRGVRAVGPSSASIMMFLVPVTGLVTSAVFLGESFGAVQAAGAAVLLTGAVLAVTQGRLPRRRRGASAPAEPTPTPTPAPTLASAPGSTPAPASVPAPAGAEPEPADGAPSPALSATRQAG